MRRVMSHKEKAQSAFKRLQAELTRAYDDPVNMEIAEIVVARAKQYRRAVRKAVYSPAHPPGTEYSFECIPGTAMMKIQITTSNRDVLHQLQNILGEPL